VLICFLEIIDNKYGRNMLQNLGVDAHASWENILFYSPRKNLWG
jgi:hypothetical protein